RASCPSGPALSADSPTDQAGCGHSGRRGRAADCRPYGGGRGPMQLSLSMPLELQDELVAGVDEVGRGPLAGEVVAAAVILDPARPIDGLNDSKKLTARQRERLHDEILDKALCHALGRASVME